MGRSQFDAPDRPLSEATVRCYVRPSVAPEPVAETVERLRSLGATGRVGRVLVEAWPGRVLPESTTGERVADTYRLFREWADDHDLGLTPAFGRRRCRSAYTDTTWEELVTPVVCLAVHDHGRLVAVYPHTDEDAVVTVGDALDAIEGGTLAGSTDRDWGDADAASEPATATACPGCGGSLLNGQGLYVCPDCGWSGTRAARRRPAGERVGDPVP
jgi:hypothetical protein